MYNTISPDKYLIYLRKSRADLAAHGASVDEAEAEVLARHEATLVALAKKLNLVIGDIYREVGSGDTIASRPVMQQLLTEVEQGLWAGVLVMEVERLARGDTMDQGLVAQTFKFSDTLIVTPTKTYDPNDEFDEEYFEFGLFMSRREYKTINRRLQRGRLAAVQEGQFMGSRAPYGYLKAKTPDGKGHTLAIDPDKAEVVRLIFDLYVHGEPGDNSGMREMGTTRIASYLNTLKIPSAKGTEWVTGTVCDVLSNPVYIGKIRWNRKKQYKKIVNGKPIIHRPIQPLENCVLVDGLHEAIIDEATWHEAQRIKTLHPGKAPTPGGWVTKNPLSGLMICGKCGKKMTRRVNTKGAVLPALICASVDCDNVSSYLHYVERRVVDGIEAWLKQYKINIQNNSETFHPQIAAAENAISSIEEDLLEIKKQSGSLHDFLEKGIYDIDTFLERSNVLAGRQKEKEAALRKAKATYNKMSVREQAMVDIIPKAENLLSVYDTLGTAEAKNLLLKQVLDKVVYTRDVGGRWHPDKDNFRLRIYPKVPSEFIEA